LIELPGSHEKVSPHTGRSAQAAHPIGLQNPSNHKVSRPEGGAFITPGLAFQIKEY